MSQQTPGWWERAYSFLKEWPIGVASAAVLGGVATVGVFVIKQRYDASILSEIEGKGDLVKRKGLFARPELELYLSKALTASKKFICVTGMIKSLTLLCFTLFNQLLLK